MKTPQFIFLLTDAWVISSFRLENVNKAARNICAQVFVWTYLFISAGYVPRSRTAASHCLHVISQATTKQFSQVAVLVYIPASNAEVAQSF